MRLLLLVNRTLISICDDKTITSFIFCNGEVVGMSRLFQKVDVEWASFHVGLDDPKRSGLFLMVYSKMEFEVDQDRNSICIKYTAKNEPQVVSHALRNNSDSKIRYDNELNHQVLGKIANYFQNYFPSFNVMVGSSDYAEGVSCISLSGPCSDLFNRFGGDVVGEGAILSKTFIESVLLCQKLELASFAPKHLALS